MFQKVLTLLRILIDRIISEPSTTAFHAPFPRFAFEAEDTKWANPNYSSYVQYRGRSVSCDFFCPRHVLEVRR